MDPTPAYQYRPVHLGPLAWWRLRQALLHGQPVTDPDQLPAARAYVWEWLRDAQASRRHEWVVRPLFGAMALLLGVSLLDSYFHLLHFHFLHRPRLDTFEIVASSVVFVGVSRAALFYRRDRARWDRSVENARKALEASELPRGT
jgi:hypothetical protein